MSFLTKLLSGVLAELGGRILDWLKSLFMDWQKKKESEKENKEAVDKIREAESDEDFDEAARSISDRLNK